LTKFLASTGAVVGTYSVNVTDGAGVAMTFDGTNLWVSITGDDFGVVAKVLASTGATVGSYEGGGGGITFDGTNIWVVDGEDPDTVAKLLPNTGATVGTYSVGSSPSAILFAGANIWVANEGGSSVTKIAD
jgi:hypothetical protein